MLERKQKPLLLDLPLDMLLGKQRSQHVSVVTATSCSHGQCHQQDYSHCRLGFVPARVRSAGCKEINSLLRLVLEQGDHSPG